MTIASIYGVMPGRFDPAGVKCCQMPPDNDTLSRERVREAVILYPSVGGNVSEQVVEIREPSYGDQQARVILRAVNLVDLTEAVGCRGVQGERWRGEMAEAMALRRKSAARL